MSKDLGPLFHVGWEMALKEVDRVIGEEEEELESKIQFKRVGLLEQNIPSEQRIEMEMITTMEMKLLVIGYIKRRLQSLATQPDQGEETKKR